MKRIAILIFLSALFSLSGKAASSFEQANQFYTTGQFAQAITLYQQLIDSATATQALDQDIAPVYYNLGNSYYKKGELANAILAYERALRLDPSLDDATYNLEIARGQITDNIISNDSFFLARWCRAVRDTMNLNTWMWLSFVLFVVSLMSILLFLLSRTMWKRKLGFHLGWVMLVLTVISGLNATSLYQRNTAKDEAIIMQGIVSAKSSPDKTGTDLFTLHEGTKVTTHETIGDWTNITVGNYEGWIPTATFVLI